MLFADAFPDADVRLSPGWLVPAEATALQAQLVSAVPWEVHRIRMFGRTVDSPRLSCWMGDADAHYRYSGTDFVPQPWTPALQALRERLQTYTGAPFNSVLLNRYRDGDDAMGWHSDNEPELGPDPLIASVSLGGARRFLLRRRDNHARRAELLLDHGDLLLMGSGSQRHYQHSLPRTARPVAERINLTFRQIGRSGIGHQDVT